MPSQLIEPYLEVYREQGIRKDNTIKQNKFYSIVDGEVLYGGSISILKRKIDKTLSKVII